MAAFREGKVASIENQSADLVRLVISTALGDVPAIAYPQMIGTLGVGDRVIVNTTGLELDLGTGGDAFVLWNLDGPEVEPGSGHIVKLRYTPWQTEVLSVEAPESEHHALLRDVDSLDGLPVVACGLHSQIAGVAAGIKAANRQAKVGYLMSDGGSLPIAWSKTVRSLAEAGLLDITGTYGHAFGGDIEAVNLYSGLVALAKAARVDVIVVAMGPGGVGTGTRLGFSGIELAQIVDAVGALNGNPVACMRISFSDARDRHEGISHHSLTSLGLAARRCRIALPKLSPGHRDLIVEQLNGSGACHRHELVFADGRPGVDLLLGRGIDPLTMGRPMSKAPEPFLAASAAGSIAASLLDV
jgi:hypothetical protein